jgi:uncharacterized protein (TIGR00251 family)
MSGDATAWLTIVPQGALLRIHVHPGASRAGVRGFHGDALRVRVTSQPVEGAANRELLAILARALGVSRAALSLVTGEKGRDKKVLVHGLGVDAIRERLGDTLSVDKVSGRD